MDDPHVSIVTTADPLSTVQTHTTLSTPNSQTSNSSSLSNARSSKGSVPISSMAWFLLIIITLWLFGAMAISILSFCYTKNPISFALFTTLAPPAYILYWIVKRVFPEPESIIKLRIKKNAQRPISKTPKSS